MWEEDAAKWREQHKHRRKFDAVDYDLVPFRPSYLPAGHLLTESTEKTNKPCPEGCLVRHGDNEILAMIKAARKNPKGGGWKEIPQKSAPGSPKKAKKVAGDGDGEADPSQADASVVSRLFGDVTPDDLERWGVHP